MCMEEALIAIDLHTKWTWGSHMNPELHSPRECMVTDSPSL